MLTRESLIEWATHWVSDVPRGQRQCFAEALAEELRGWSSTAEKEHLLEAARVLRLMGQGPPLDGALYGDLRKWLDADHLLKLKP